MVGGLLVVVCPTISAADDPWPVSTLCVQGLLCPAKHTPWTVYSTVSPRSRGLGGRVVLVVLGIGMGRGEGGCSHDRACSIQSTAALHHHQEWRVMEELSTQWDGMKWNDHDNEIER